MALIQNRGRTPLTLCGDQLIGLPWSRLEPMTGFAPDELMLQPGETGLYQAIEPPPIVVRGFRSATDAAADQRIEIASVSPSVDGGRFAVKRIQGQPITAEARIFADGHEQLAAAVSVRAADEEDWVRYPLTAGPNDLWSARFSLHRLGRHMFRVEAWRDVWGGFTRDFRKKRDDGQPLALDIREGGLLLEAALPNAPPAAATEISAAINALASAVPSEASECLLGEALAAAMASTDTRPFLIITALQPIEVEREAALYSSWYELFPRSASGDPARHGSFADVIGQLPHIAAMGFDTLYFPPIHPIGRTNRKGPNNTLNAGPDDVGSAYAIGSSEGGHTAIHPQLGTLEDFRTLVNAAGAQGLEIALDFAIQCSPDHPWLQEHPGWFDWRPDGSIKYAENPPKRYEDIVNVDFYAPGAIPSLWEALRDVVLFWVDQGVRAFRVDNPHTKPLPFWEWMIGDVKSRHPEIIFLSEAFTRPGPMYRLAKAGFSQSYTYFTWRHTKAEFQDYLTELTQTEVREFFRPHFFVNTPDINPYFLQTSGRPGFLIRAALAATLSGLFGVYSGFELCEAAAPPGREEYLDSEKYQLRPRPQRAPGDIVDEITVLNRIRREEPALQSHLGISFHNAFNDQIVYFSKAAPGRDERILVAISLDPHAALEADIEVPLWLFDLADWDGIGVDDLLSGRRFRWTGKVQHIRLEPERPYAIWRLSADGDA
ncbi:MAG TPA: alpha-1,4-glucan--maltose-1-phosphate maltosyltransferase [Caulobacteraceae bacterium]|nr:alpha-1,4-glucan--maltose-1-phosphate maltosyltransferase [Caulobacteraceae bacterium]